MESNWAPMPWWPNVWHRVPFHYFNSYEPFVRALCILSYWYLIASIFFHSPPHYRLPSDPRRIIIKGSVKPIRYLWPCNNPTSTSSCLITVSHAYCPALVGRKWRNGTGLSLWMSRQGYKVLFRVGLLVILIKAITLFKSACEWDGLVWLRIVWWNKQFCVTVHGHWKMQWLKSLLPCFFKVF